MAVFLLPILWIRYKKLLCIRFTRFQHKQFNLNRYERNYIIVFNVGEHFMIIIPPGAYEMMKSIKQSREISHWKSVAMTNMYINCFFLKANNYTLKCDIPLVYDMDMIHKNSFATLSGFEWKILRCGKKHESTFLRNITKIQIICADCNIFCRSYVNGVEAHTLFEFDIKIEPEYKLTKGS